MALRKFSGIVLEFNRDRGFAYVRVMGPHAKAFLHIKDFPPHVGAHHIDRGMKVEFYLENHAKGLRAIRAELIK